MSITFIDSFTDGCFRVMSETGKQVCTVEDSERFGPTFVNMKTGDLAEIPERHWFWRFYTPWIEAGRPTSGSPMNTPNGPLELAVWAKAAPEPRP